MYNNQIKLLLWSVLQDMLCNLHIQESLYGLKRNTIYIYTFRSDTFVRERVIVSTPYRPRANWGPAGARTEVFTKIGELLWQMSLQTVSTARNVITFFEKARIDSV